MKTIQELEEIRKNTVDKVKSRNDRIAAKIVVGMDTTGIAGGARAVVVAIMDEIKELELADTILALNGNVEFSNLEPIVEVTRPGQEKVTYVNMTPEKAKRVVKDHVAGGKVVEEYTINKVEHK